LPRPRIARHQSRRRLRAHRAGGRAGRMRRRRRAHRRAVPLPVKPESIRNHSMQELQKIIDDAFEARANLSPSSAPSEVRDAVARVIAGLDAGTLRVAEKRDGEWAVNQWVKKAVLISFRLADNQPMPGGSTQYFDKVPTKFADYTPEQFREGGFRV